MDIDEEYATTLLSLLDDDLPTRPSTVDVRRAIVDGRRRKRIRRASRLVAAVGATVVVLAGIPVAVGTLHHRGTSTVTGPQPSGTPASVAASPGPSQSWVPVPSTGPAVTGLAPNPPTSCTLHRLPIPNGVTMSLVTAGDPTGHYITGRSYPRGGSGAGYPVIIWHDGEPIVVQIPGADQTLQQITSNGDAVGQSFVNGGQGSVQVAWAYVGGELTRLQGSNAEARGINTADAIVGKVGDQPVVWRSPYEAAEKLPMPPGATSGEAYGIDDDGTIVGTVGTASGEHGYVWRPDGSVEQLPPVPSGSGPSTGERAFVIRNGWVGGLGMFDGDKAGNYAVRWNLRTGRATVVSGLDMVVSAVNRYGWTAGSDKQGYGMLQTDDGTLRMPALNKKVQSLDNIASTLSDDGRTIAGQAVLADASRTIVAVVWNCT